MKMTKIKTILLFLLGERIVSWIQALRFIYLIKFKKNSEPEMELLSEFLSSGDIAIDVGANGANWTSRLSQNVGSSGFVFAFEVDPYYANSTKIAIQLMKMKNTLLFPIGLSDKKEILDLIIMDEDGLRYTGKSHIVGNNEENNNKTQSIQLVPLDSLIDDYKRLLKVSLIKCDVEGYELLVLKGARKVIQNSRPIIIIEIGNYEKYGYDSNTVFKYFKEIKYSSYTYLISGFLSSTDEFFNHPDSISVNRILIPMEKVSNFSNLIIN